MGRAATTAIPANDQAIKKILRDSVGEKPRDLRIKDNRGLVLRTQKSGTGVFYTYYTNKRGKRRKYPIGPYGALSLAEARAQTLSVLNRVALGEDPAGERQAEKGATIFKDLAEAFLKKGDLANTTKEAYRYALEKDAYPKIGDVPADSVTSDDILEICMRIEERETTTQSDRTKAAIGGVYRWGRKQRIVKADPCHGIGRRSKKVARTRTPSDKELKLLWSALDDPELHISDPMKLIVRLAIITGQRRTEVAGARVFELDLVGNFPIWIIPGDEKKKGKIVRGRTKNGREQQVPLSKQAVALFKEALKLKDDNSEYLFPADLSRVRVGKVPRTHHINGESVSRAMRRVRDVAGVEDVTVHDMRRAISNWLKDQGVSREVRDLVLNHKDPSVTEEHYSSSARMLKPVKNALQKWADNVDATVANHSRSSNVVKLIAS